MTFLIGRVGLGLAVLSSVGYPLTISLMAASVGSADFEAQIESGRWLEAGAAAQIVIQDHPADAKGWYHMGRVLFERGRSTDLADSVTHLSHAVSLDPRLAPAWFWLGRASGQAAGAGGWVERIQLARQARKAFVTALEIEPDSFLFAYALVQFYLRAPAVVGGGAGKAEDVVREFDGRHPDEDRLLEASVLFASKQDERVFALLSKIESFDQALIEETWEEIVRQLGRRQLSELSWDAAVRTYRLMIERQPDQPGGYLGLGRALEGRGDIEGAQRAYDEHSQLGP